MEFLYGIGCAIALVGGGVLVFGGTLGNQIGTVIMGVVLIFGAVRIGLLIATDIDPVTAFAVSAAVTIIYGFWFYRK